MQLWNNASIKLMEQTLDAATFRQKVIANNVANADTPYFKRSNVVFEELLAKELTKKSIQGYRTDPRHIPIGSAAQIEPQAVTDESTIMNNNLNNVDIDYEMALMAKNQLRYNVVVQQLGHELKMYRTALNGGR